MKNLPFAEIPFFEISKRIEDIKKSMWEFGFDALLLFDRRNIGYLTGYRRTVMTMKVEGLFLPLKGNSILLVPQISSDYCRKCAWVDEIRVYGGANYLGNRKTISELAAEVIQDGGLSKAKIGSELGGGMLMDITYSDFLALSRALPNVRFEDISQLLWDQRSIKSSWEIGIIRELCRIAVKGFRRGLDTLREGVTEREVQKAIISTWVSEGAFDTPLEGQMLIRTGISEDGPNGRYPSSHCRPGDFPIRRGEMVMFDAGPCYKGYFADIQRQACIGQPSSILKRLFDIAMEGYEAGVELLNPEVSISEICKTALNKMKKIDSQIQYPLSFFGHSIGLSIHEPPWFTLSEQGRLKPGMIVNFEVGAYDIPLWRTLGGFPEDMFLITEDRAENLTGELSRDLWVVD